MITELWSAFPRLMVQKINELLDEAEPSPTKAFQLYKACQSENLWSGSFEKFQKHLDQFYSRARYERRKSHFDGFLERPMGMEVYELFHLTFRTATVSNKSLMDIANWAHHLSRVSCKSNSAIISEDVFAKTIRYITNPPHFEGKDQNIEFEDFCQAWQKTVVKLFGKKYEGEFNAIVSELRGFQSQLVEDEKHIAENGFFPTLYLTQTEIDWVLAVRKAAEENKTIPKFPLSRGPQKLRLIELEKTLSLYKIVQNTNLPELMRHRDNIRATILDRCDALIRDKAA